LAVNGSLVHGLVRKEFEHKKATVEVNISNYHLFLDFVHMIQLSFRTSMEQPMAWIDEDGCSFFPEVYIDADEKHSHCHHEVQKDGFLSLSQPNGSQEIKLQIEIEVNGSSGSNLMDYCGESTPLVKRIKVGQDAEAEDSCDKVSDVRMNEHVGENQHLERNLDTDVETGGGHLDTDTAGEIFLNGMSSVGGVDVVDICSNSGPLLQGRWELFLKQVQITKSYRRNPNVRYAWLASTKEASSGIMAHGLRHFGLQQPKPVYGIGAHLTAENCADTRYNFILCLFKWHPLPHLWHICVCTHLFTYAMELNQGVCDIMTVLIKRF